MWQPIMFARSHKSLMLMHHYQNLAKGTGPARPPPACFFPFWQHSPTAVRMMSSEPKPPSPEGEPPSSSDTKKLFVISSSKSAPNLTSEGSSLVNHLPPKPRLDRNVNGTPGATMDLAKLTAWFKNQSWQQLATQGKDRVVAMVGTIFTRDTADRIQNALTAGWEMSVRTASSIAYWTRLFLDSREYFYLRYYTLLLLENAVHYVRLGFAAVMRRVRPVSKE